MKLYYMPGACSIGIHVLLEEIGKPYDLQKIDGAKQEQYGPDFVKINPKSKVPTLQRDDGSVLTEFPAIATWLARKNPEKGLLPSDRRRRGARARGDGLRRVDHAHAGLLAACSVRATTRRPKPTTTRSRRAARRSWKRASPLMDKALEGKEYVAGKFSVADAALFYVEFWAAGRMKMPLPKNCAAHYERMKARPAVKRVLEQEGLTAAV